MTVASVDDQGRVYLPKDLREKYGGRFRIVETRDEIIFIPLPEDPLENFQEKEALEDKSVESLREEINKSVES